LVECSRYGIAVLTNRTSTAQLAVGAGSDRDAAPTRWKGTSTTTRCASAGRRGHRRTAAAERRHIIHRQCCCL